VRLVQGPMGPLQYWVDEARADRTHGRTGLATAERDILKKEPRPSSRSTSCKVRLDRGGEGRVHGHRVLSRPERLAS
jgi:hypothetical protein